MADVDVFYRVCETTFVRRPYKTIGTYKPCTEVSYRPQQSKLEDVPDGCGGISASPPVNGVIKPSTCPPVRVLSSQVENRLIPANRKSLPDTIRGKHRSFGMSPPCCEKLQMLFIEFSPERARVGEILINRVPLLPAFQFLQDLFCLLKELASHRNIRRRESSFRI